jgi:hypothetical protein
VLGQQQAVSEIVVSAHRGPPPRDPQAVCAVTEPAMQLQIASNAPLRAHLLASLLSDRN